MRESSEISAFFFFSIFTLKIFLGMVHIPHCLLAFRETLMHGAFLAGRAILAAPRGRVGYFAVQKGRGRASGCCGKAKNAEA